ncbi:MAG: metalloregulator ArsR/SmtB family transcription factor [Candidatus Shapirobacteria bacterium]
MDKIFKALVDKNRRKVITLLKEQDLSVNEILKSFTISQATLSSHLAVLRKCGLVRCRVNGKQRIYGLNKELLAAFTRELNKFIGLVDLGLPVYRTN